MTALGQDAALSPLFATWGRLIDGQSDSELRSKSNQRLIDEAKAEGKPKPELPWVPNYDSWGPGMLWNGMIAPLTPFPIRGVIWYQGETNSASSGRRFMDASFAPSSRIGAASGA